MYCFGTSQIHGLATMSQTSKVPVSLKVRFPRSYYEPTTHAPTDRPTHNHYTHSHTHARATYTCPYNKFIIVIIILGVKLRVNGRIKLFLHLQMLTKQ